SSAARRDVPSFPPRRSSDLPGEPVLIGGEESGGIGLSAHLPERDGLANALVLLEAVVTSGEGLADAFARLERETGWRHAYDRLRSEEHTSELQSRENLVCRP